MKILIVEDEVRLSGVLQKGLKKLGFAVDAAYDGEEALYSVQINSYDLIILDLNLPKIGGFDVLKKIRTNNDTTKILILSAKNQVEDKVRGLDLGANDYLEKPFDFLELSARIRNLLRWDFILQEDTITYKDVSINRITKMVLKNNEEIHLTNKEYGILEYLSKNNERYIGAEEIIEHVWDSEADLFSNSFKFHISSLKKKLSTEGIVINIRGKGYKFGGISDENSKV